MRYLLVVGFACNVYRREPRARLFFNEKLIDEFYIAHQVKKNFLHTPSSLKHPLEPYANNKSIREYIRNKLPTLRFYSVDVDDRLQKGSIRIDIDNDDSNHTNGFVTNSTNLQLYVLSLLPAERKIYEWFKTKACNQKFTTEKYAWHQKTNKNIFFNLINSGLWAGKNGQKFDNLIFFNIGGSGFFYFELIKKYGILLGKLKLLERPYIYDTFFACNKLYDKYEEHENKRNNN